MADRKHSYAPLEPSDRDETEVPADRKPSCTYDLELSLSQGDETECTDVEDSLFDEEEAGYVQVKGVAPSSSSKLALGILVFLTAQNCSKNLFLRYVMQGHPKFLTSAAVLGSECLKVLLSMLYILFVQRQTLTSIYEYLRVDWRNTLLLVIPACAYNIQMSLEYVALAHMSAASYSVMVQAKVLFTALFAFIVLNKQLTVVQVSSLLLLTTGVMLCNYTGGAGESDLVGIIASLVISLSSGFATVYTEKVIKAQARQVNVNDYGLAYSQIQLALSAILTIGLYAIIKDHEVIQEHGLFYNFSSGAVMTVVLSAVGGLTVGAVLKFADSILKNQAAAASIVLTGVLSHFIFGTEISLIYAIGVINVVVAMGLYNGDLSMLGALVCSTGMNS